MSKKLTVQQLESALKEHRLNKADFLRDLSISKQRYQNWKIRGIPANELPGIAQYTKISMDDLMGTNYKVDRKDIHDEIDRLPEHLLDKARHMLEYIKTSETESAQTTPGAAKAIRKRS